MSELQVTPFVPGNASGIICRGVDSASVDCIAVLTQKELDKLTTRPSGIIVIDGAPFSHAMIRLLVLGIPTVMISASMLEQLEAGKTAYIDGLDGRIVQPPPPSPQKTEPASQPAGSPLYLSDSSEVMLRASIINADEARRAVALAAAAIGLVRTEFMVPANGAQPDTAFYQKSLNALCVAAHPLALTLRLPDITQDKPVPWLTPLEHIVTPLGFQGLRLYDREPVRTVIFAMLDAIRTLPDDRSVSLLLPYVTRIDEFQRWRSMIEQHLHRPIAIGAMLESPAAVLALAHWFEYADFVGIGCNDLMQCLFAADRDLAAMRGYLDATSPELFRFLQQAAVAAGEHIDKVQLCGLLPQLPGVLPVLIGMGFRVFAVAPVMIPYLARTVADINLSQAQALARQVCAAKDSQTVSRLLARISHQAA